jgi:hypothetical protein
MRRSIASSFCRSCWSVTIVPVSLSPACALADSPTSTPAAMSAANCNRRGQVIFVHAFVLDAMTPRPLQRANIRRDNCETCSPSFQ